MNLNLSCNTDRMKIHNTMMTKSRQNNSDPTCSEKFIGVATLLYKKIAKSQRKGTVDHSNLQQT